MKRKDNYSIISMLFFARVVQAPEPFGSDCSDLKTADKKHIGKKNEWQPQKTLDF